MKEKEKAPRPQRLVHNNSDQQLQRSGLGEIRGRFILQDRHLQQLRDLHCVQRRAFEQLIP